MNICFLGPYFPNSANHSELLIIPFRDLMPDRLSNKDENGDIRNDGERRGTYHVPLTYSLFGSMSSFCGVSLLLVQLYLGNLVERV